MPHQFSHKSETGDATDQELDQQAAGVGIEIGVGGSHKGEYQRNGNEDWESETHECPFQQSAT